MRTILLSLLAIIILIKLIRWTGDLPGRKFARPRKGDFPWEAQDLREEIPGLHESIYNTFQMGADFQIQGEFQCAKLEYDRLRSIPGVNPTEKFDLVEWSSKFRHNLDLLERQLRWGK